MKKQFLLLGFALLMFSLGFAHSTKDTATVSQISFVDSVNNAMIYQSGKVVLPKGIATLNVPANFKYLNQNQSNFIINKIWENPYDDEILGMLFPSEGGPFADVAYAYVITFNEIGFVKDADVRGLNYMEMLKKIHHQELEENEARSINGYETVHMTKWAQQPFYDKKTNVLHWAKELKFGDQKEHTLNYEVRFLGRAGVLSFNAVTSVSQLQQVKKDISQILEMPSFTKGNDYNAYQPIFDNLADYSLEGLVAGRATEASVWSILSKSWKVLVAVLLLGCLSIVHNNYRKKGNKELRNLSNDPLEPMA